MELKKAVWTKQDILEFESYLLSFSKGKEKAEWEKKIINTSLPCIAVPAPKLKELAKEIGQGNFESFLNYWLWNNFTEVSINGNLICQIKNFEKMKKYLIKYVNKIDNWANCDLLKFKINKNNEEQFFNLSKELINSPKPFVKRVGIIILFDFTKNEKYLNNIFEILNLFEKEQEYYVNMANAWLVCELFIKNREKTLKYLENNNKLNSFTINKAISKCRDSFRVSKEDKEMLLKFKR